MGALIYRANVQYRCGDETVTFSRDQHMDDPLPSSFEVIEINGKQAVTGEIIPDWILKFWAYDITPPIPALDRDMTEETDV